MQSERIPASRSTGWQESVIGGGVIGPQEEIAYNEIIDYTRRSDGGSDNIYACHCHEAALLLASKKMGSEQYKVLTIDSSYYFSSGYFKTSYTDNIAGNEW